MEFSACRLMSVLNCPNLEHCQFQILEILSPCHNCFWSCLMMREEKLRPVGRTVKTEACHMFSTEKPRCESSWAPHILTYACGDRRTCKAQAAMWLLQSCCFQRKQCSFQSHWLSTLVIQKLQNISRVRSLCCPSFVHYRDSFNSNNIPSWSARKCFSKESFLALGFVFW